MGDTYLYRVRCVQTACSASDTVEGCPALCSPEEEEEPEVAGPFSAFAWADNGNGTLRSINLETEVSTLLVSEQNYPLGIAHDPLTNTLFWPAYTQKMIHRRVLPDGPILSFEPPGDNPAALAFDPEDQRLYWTETVGGALRRSAPDGSNVETLVSGLAFGVGLALDLSGGKVYWSEESADVIRRANLDGSGVEEVVSSGIDQPRGLSVAHGQVYWVDRGTQSLRRQSAEGGAVEVLASGFAFLQDVDIDPDTMIAYIIDDGIASAGSIHTLDLESGAQALLIGGLANPKHGMLWQD